jgi:choline dehydrogenase-like flavoprotein
LLDKNTGKAKGVAYIDGQTRAPRELMAKVVLLCAGTIETTRIMLNSRSLDGTEGIANSSGVLGHY